MCVSTIKVVATSGKASSVSDETITVMTTTPFAAIPCLLLEGMDVSFDETIPSLNSSVHSSVQLQPVDEPTRTDQLLVLDQFKATASRREIYVCTRTCMSMQTADITNVQALCTSPAGIQLTAR